MKILEKAAIALYKDSGWNDWENESREAKITWIYRASVVYDSSKILILPADAEPILGDYLRVDVEGWNRPKYGNFDDVMEFINPANLGLPYKIKIIAREGYNSVLQESE